MRRVSRRLLPAALILATLTGCMAGSGAPRAAPSAATSRPEPAGSAESHAVIRLWPARVRACIVPTPVTPPGHPLVKRARVTCVNNPQTTDLNIPMTVFRGPLVGKVAFESGIVAHNGSGRPVRNARVSLHVKTLKHPLVATTDKRGQYVFLNIPLGPKGCAPGDIVVTARGYGTNRIASAPYIRDSYEREVMLSHRYREHDSRPPSCSAHAHRS